MLPAPENPIGRSNAGCGPSCAEPTGKPVGADRISPVLERMILGQLPIPLSDPLAGTAGGAPALPRGCQLPFPLRDNALKVSRSVKDTPKSFDTARCVPFWDCLRPRLKV